MTREKAIDIAKEYGLEYEVTYCMDHGDTPEEALQEWDIQEDNKPVPVPIEPHSWCISCWTVKDNRK